MKRLSGLILLSTVLGAAAVHAQDDQEAILERFKASVICTCPCPHLVGQCGDECGVAPQLLAEAKTVLASGVGEAELYRVFEAKYGQVIYAAPKAEGFNLLGWILPFVALGFGGLLVWGVVRRLHPSSETLEAEAEAKTAQIDERYRKVLEEELKE